MSRLRGMSYARRAPRNARTGRVGEIEIVRTGFRNHLHMGLVLRHRVLLRHGPAQGHTLWRREQLAAARAKDGNARMLNYLICNASSAELSVQLARCGGVHNTDEHGAPHCRTAAPAAAAPFFSRSGTVCIPKIKLRLRRGAGGRAAWCGRRRDAWGTKMRSGNTLFHGSAAATGGGLHHCRWLAQARRVQLHSHERGLLTRPRCQ